MKIVKIIFLSIVFVFLSALLGTAIYFYYAVSTPNLPNRGYIDFTVNSGETKMVIAQNLENEGIIKNKWLAIGYWMFTRQVIKTGKYSLTPSDNIIKISDILVNSQQLEKKILIKEGWSSWQIAQTLSDAKLADYNEALAAATKQEGYLFPDTYRIAENSTLTEILKNFFDNFNNRTADLKPTKDQVIIASLLEREGKTFDEKQKIASVIQNRLKIGMSLDLDATIQYAKGSWAVIHHDDIVSTNSPYNTYKNTGLPPGPICNPGLDSIKAAITPSQTDYLYYFHSRDNKAIFSRSKAEHDANIAKYGVSGS